MEILRTPEDRFDDLPDFPWQPQYVDVNGMRMAYIDEGEGQTVLCLHGEPSWGYLYRKMIPVFLAAGMRVVAPDWLGFGRSDKPVADADYTWDFHHSSMLHFVDALGLERRDAGGAGLGRRARADAAGEPPGSRVPPAHHEHRPGGGVPAHRRASSPGGITWRTPRTSTSGELMARSEPV